jgi:MerR family transcriptional regulator/heat shock protein HspR
MSPHWYSRRTVCEHLRISEATLARYERAGLVRPQRRDGEPYFGPEQLRRLWTIVSLHQDLGINLEGIRAVLRLRRQLLRTRREVRELLVLLNRRWSEEEGPDDR